MTTWTKIPKATGDSSNTIVAGTPIGLLMALTYSTSSSVNVSKWTKIIKASNTSWTKIAKASGTSWTKIAKAS